MQLDVRPVELVAPAGLQRQAQGRAPREADIAVTQRAQALAHAGRGLQHAAHGPDAALSIQTVTFGGGLQSGTQIHVAAALGVDLAARGSEVPDGATHGRIGGQPGGKGFRVAAAQIQGVRLRRQGRIPQGREGDDLPAAGAQGVLVGAVIKAKRLVPGHSQPPLPLSGGGQGRPQRPGPARQSQQAVQIHMIFRQFRQTVRPCRIAVAFSRGQQAQLPFGDAAGLVAGQGAQQGRQPGLFQSLTQNIRMARAAGIVGDDARQPDAMTCRLLLETFHQRRQRGGHAPHVDHQQHGQVQHTGTIQRAAGKVVRGAAVQQAHDTLADSGVGSLHGGPPLGAHTGLAHHPGIQIAGRATGSQRMEGGVDVIRPAFAALHGKAPADKGPHQGHGHGGLALAGAGSGQTKGEEVPHQRPSAADAGASLSRYFSA